MSEPQPTTIPIETAAAEADVDVETYVELLRSCELEVDGPVPTEIDRDDHELVMLSLSIPPPL